MTAHGRKGARAHLDENEKIFRNVLDDPRYRVSELQRQECLAMLDNARTRKARSPEKVDGVPAESEEETICHSDKWTPPPMPASLTPLVSCDSESQTQKNLIFNPFEEGCFHQADESNVAT